MTRNSCKKEIPAPSGDRARKQDEALTKGADMVRCIQELQTITTAETGEPSGDIEFALSGSYDMAIGLASDRTGSDIEGARQVLEEYGYPDLLGD